eukprot:g45051.t1
MGRASLPEFQELFLRGFLEARKHARELLVLVSLMQNSGLPCFAKGPAALNGLKNRLMLHRTENQCKVAVRRLIQRSLYHWRSRLYDRFQYVTQGIH